MFRQQATSRVCTLAIAAIAALLLVGVHGTSAQEFAPTWTMPTEDSVRKQVMDWLASSKFDEQAKLAVVWHWDPKQSDPGAPADLLTRLVDTFAAAYPQAAELRRQCHEPYSLPRLPDATWLADQAYPPLVRNNLRMYYARWLLDHRLYDEALAQLEGLSPADVVDPAGLLFSRMIAHQQLVEPDDARAALVELLEHEAELPARYRELANLLQQDLGGLDDKSLDHIVRRMHDVRRRLEYGRAGDTVQTIENGIVKDLDKKIDQLQQQQQQQQQQAGSGGSPQSSKPMDDSRIAELKAPGRVDPRKLGDKSGWGDLPPKEREQALQQVGREFPAHYRELIEEYFRELANEPSPASP
jgi:hypothetical protein